MKEDYEMTTEEFARLRGIPARFRTGMDTIGRVVSDAHVQQAIKWAKDFRQGDPAFTGLYISGGLGTGKTALAYAIAIEVMKGGVEAKIDTFSNILMKIRTTYRKDSERSEEGYTSELVKVPLLVLDDLGQEPPSEFAAVKLYDIVNERYNHCRPMIVTSNLTGQDLQDKAKAAGWTDEWRRLIDRFVSMLTSVRLDGPSKRKGARKC